jgi:glyoxylase-like metal-dependent hydrolase (beta-lactamase superfamily II)
MTQIADGVHRLGTELVNFYLVEQGGRCTLVDAALPGYYDGLVEALRANGKSLDAIDAVVLTHAHGDHIGLAERVRTEAGAPVHVHADDAEMARTGKLPKRDGSFLPHLVKPAALKLIWHFTRNGGMRPARVNEVSTFGDGDVLDVPGRPRVIATPGHSPGHVALHFEQHGVLFTGDALCSRNPLTGREGPQIMPSAFNTSTEQARESLNRIEPLTVTHLLFGHGDPWTQGAAAAVARARELGAS